MTSAPINRRGPYKRLPIHGAKNHDAAHVRDYQKETDLAARIALEREREAALRIDRIEVREPVSPTSKRQLVFRD